MSKSFDEILNECIRHLETSGGDIDAALSRYPERAEELRAHLEVWTSLSAVDKTEASPQGAAWIRQRLLTAVAQRREAESQDAINSLMAKGGRTMKFVLMFVAGAAAALGITFLAGSLDLGGGSTAQADPVAECLEGLDLNGDGTVDVGDVEAFRTAIDEQDLAFDYNGDGVVDVFDVSALALAISECLFNINPPPDQEFPSS